MAESSVKEASVTVHDLRVCTGCGLCELCRGRAQGPVCIGHRDFNALTDELAEDADDC